MKKTILSMIPILFAASNAFAVDTKQCPATLSISYDSLYAYNDEDLQANNGEMWDHPTILRYNQRLAEITSDDLSFSTKLKETKSGVCHYYVGKTRVARLYTQKGTDLLAIYLGKGLATYHVIDSYSPESIEVTDSESNVRLEDWELSAYTVGLGYGLNLSVD